MSIYLVRHAKSEANVKNLFGTNFNLCEEGVLQAKSISSSIGVTPDIVISGELNRHIQTASLLFPDLYDNVTTRAFNEIYFGSLENEEAIDEVVSEIVSDVSVIKTKYNGDNVWDRVDKALDFIMYLSKKFKDMNIAIVTSDTLIQCIICKLVHGEVNGVIWSGKYYVDNCTFVELVLNDDLEVSELYYKGENIFKG